MKNLFSKYFSLNQDSMEIKRELREDYFYVAACAILIEIAKIDGEFSGEEISTILFYLQNEHNLAQDEAEEILSEAEEELKHSIDLWKFTNAINKNYSKEGTKIGIFPLLRRKNLGREFRDKLSLGDKVPFHQEAIILPRFFNK